MNFFSARKLTAEETREELKCIRCGDRPNIVQVMLDARKANERLEEGGIEGKLVLVAPETNPKRDPSF